uniref:Uncharacterized protein n=1 Tax=Ditylenchus dipsaci TaxID=166011 RepID=A0A915CTP0_9BILA
MTSLRYAFFLCVAGFVSLGYIHTSGAHDHRRLLDNGLSSPVEREIKALDELLSGKTATRIQRTTQVRHNSQQLFDDSLEKFELSADPKVLRLSNMQKAIGSVSIRAFIAKNVLLGKQSRLYSGFKRFSPVASSSSAVFPFNCEGVKALSSSAVATGVQVVVMRNSSSDSSSSVDHSESVMDSKVKVPLWEYLSKHSPRNVYAETDHTFSDLLREGKMQLRFLIPRDIVESLSSAGDEFFKSLDEHGASLELYDWKLPEGMLTLVCPLEKVTDCFKKSFLKLVMTRKNRVYQLKGDEETMLYFLDHVIGVLKEKTRGQIEVPFNEKSHVGTLVEDFGGFEPDYSGSLEDGNVTVRFSIPRDVLATINTPDENYCLRNIRNLSAAMIKLKNPNGKKDLTTVKVTGLPVQVEQVCYMLKQGLEKTEDGKAYLRGEWKAPVKDDGNDD